MKKLFLISVLTSCITLNQIHSYKNWEVTKVKFVELLSKIKKESPNILKGFIIFEAFDVGDTLLHELGHALVGTLVGAKVVKIGIRLDGGYVSFENLEKISKNRRVLLTLAGPLSGAFFSGLLYFKYAKYLNEKDQYLNAIKALAAAHGICCSMAALIPVVLPLNALNDWEANNGKINENELHKSDGYQIFREYFSREIAASTLRILHGCKMMVELTPTLYVLWCKTIK